jgi:hypothetical protein
MLLLYGLTGAVQALIGAIEGAGVETEAFGTARQLSHTRAGLGHASGYTPRTLRLSCDGRGFFRE